MITARRSLVSGGRGRPARPVPRFRTGRVPQHRDERARCPQPAYDAAIASLRRQLEEGRSGKAYFDECVGADRPAARADRRPDRRGHRRACPDRLDDGRRKRCIGRTGAGAGRRGADQRRGAPRRARAARRPARAPRSERARGAVRRACGGGRPANPRWSRARTCRGRRGRGRRRGPGRHAGALVLLDGAQGLGAVPVDVRALGCDFYAASGQKWLCGPNGIGYLYVRGRAGSTELSPPWPGYGSPRRPHAGARVRPPATAPPLDGGLPADPPLGLGAGRAGRARARPGCDDVQDRAPRWPSAWPIWPARPHASPRAGDSTLVSWEVDDPEAEVAAAARRGIRGSPPAGHAVRARVGGRLVERGASSPGWPSSLLGHDDDAEHDRRRHAPRAPSAVEQPVGAGPAALPVAAQIDRPGGAEDRQRRRPR